MRRPLHTRILIGAVLGLALGSAAHFLWRDAPALQGFVRYVAQPIGQIFLRLLLMLVIPLVFAALALGVSGLGELRSLGRVGLKTLVYTVCVSAVAALLGLFLVSTLRPGDGISPETHARIAAGAAERAATITSGTAPKAGIELFVQAVPDNPVKAAASGDMLAVMFFALVIGIGLLLVRSEPARSLEQAIQGLYDVMMRLIQGVIGLAPYGVCALLFTLTSQLGWEVLRQLGAFVGVVLLGLALHQFVVFSLAVRLLGGRSPLWFFRGIQEAMITAFSTSSSSATLPTALRVAEVNLKLPARISRFVLTLGATANQNGTALYEGVTVLFLAQFYGIDLTLAQQGLVLVLCVVAGVGTAGVPGGSIPIIAAILPMVNVPIEGIGIILGVDRLLDMCRTVLNVSGDLVAAVVVARGEPEAPLPAVVDGAEPGS